MADAKGRCLCGKVQYQARGEPLWVAHCHCHSCRRNTGSAVATFVGFGQDRVSFTRGERAIYRSSPGVRRGFCRDCGTPLSYESEGCEGEIHLYVSTFEEPGAFVPQVHVFFAEHLPWLELHDDLPRFEATGRGAEPIAWGPKKVNDD
jgi:hypothetical protein